MLNKTYVHKFATGLLIANLLAGCGAPSAADATAVPSASAQPTAAVQANVEYADMSGYSTYNDTTTYHFINATLDHVKEMRDNGASFVFYMGYDTCPFCNAVMPVLNAEASKYGLDVYYVDALAAVDDGSLDRHQDDLLEQFKDQFQPDEDGSYAVQVPITAFYVDGKLDSFHVGFVDGYDTSAGGATTEEATEFLSAIDPGFRAVLGIS